MTLCLRYASKCKKIVNNVVMNEDKNAKMMRVLQEEIASLRQLLAQKDSAVDEDKVVHLIGPPPPLPPPPMAPPAIPLLRYQERLPSQPPPPPRPPSRWGPNESAKLGEVTKNQNFGCSTRGLPPANV